MSGDSEISGNTTQKQGGGVFVADMCAFTMSGNSKISENKANGDNSNGGGVYVASDGGFTMSGNSTISGNEATGYGGGVFNKGTFTMSKGVKSGKKVLQHVRKVRYYSSNINVATVNKSGKIKATGTGKCTIWAIANNGVRTSVKVTVK